eukprot:m.352236 g.352236  ORF g.352236 m.352236 type:complete len:92 (+) comp16473_c0_seq1:1313-1588(+)
MCTEVDAKDLAFECGCIDGTAILQADLCICAKCLACHGSRSVCVQVSKEYKSCQRVLGGMWVGWFKEVNEACGGEGITCTVDEIQVSIRRS